MCYQIEYYVSATGKRPVLEFLMEQEHEIQEKLIAGIQQLEEHNGILRNRNLETKHIRNKIFELKFRKLEVRILYAYHPVKRKFILLLHGLLKKRNDLKGRDIDTAESRYREILNFSAKEKNT